MTVATFTKTGTKATTPAKLDKAVFDVAPKNNELLKSAYVAYLANGRVNLAKTKKRGEVSGGGKKPWRQKGTGRARVGSSRNPIWRGGGIVFGPSGNENYSKNLNVKAKRLAIRQALSLSAADNRVIVIEDLKLKEAKTGELAKLLAKIGAKNRVLIVVENLDTELLRSSKNLPDVKVVQSKYVNVFDALNADILVVTNAALHIISEWLGESKPKAESK
jgi:large subunit ribosomal protein L4